ncbi:MAG: carbohydrate binding family 9 domain-containing protein [Bacteroidales bacterium]|nr:carbohydrate binding family 9 domain-containing protein [Bacteroidales bacterium]
MNVKRVLFLIITNYFFLLSYPNKVLLNDSLKADITIKRIYNTEHIGNILPKIDGKLDDACWIDVGEWSEGYKQFIPAEGAAPSQNTALKILYDDENIYVAIRAYDDPDKIDKQKGRRDDFKGDIVGVCFDSYFDHRTGFEFNLTASGGKLDIMLLNNGWDKNWNAVWYGEVAYEDSAWTAEMKIPLSQLRYSEDDKQTWGLHAWRWINRNQEEDQWNLIPRDNPGMLFSIGELHGLQDLKSSRRIEILPYTSGKLDLYPKEKNNPYSSGKEFAGNIGIDGKIGLSSNFTLDFTVNPDFGQVEADPAELNLSVYETFYEEKRPFFLEGNNITDFSLDDDLLFYSRRIGKKPSYSFELNENEYSDEPDNTTILGAVKISGKSKNGLSLGIIESLTNTEYGKITHNDEEETLMVEPLSNYFIARVQQDINKSNTMIGGIITSANRFLDGSLIANLPEYAYTGGLDFTHHFNQKTFFIEGKTVFSHISGNPAALVELQESSSRYYQRPDASHIQLDSSLTSLEGFGGEISTGKRSNGPWRYSLKFNWKSPGLELNDLGFMRNADNIGLSGQVGYEMNDPFGLFRSYSVYAEFSDNWNFAGDNLNKYALVRGEGLFTNKWELSGRFQRRSVSTDTRLLRGGPSVSVKGFWDAFFRIKTDYSKKIGFSFRHHFHIYDDKESFIRDFSPGINIKITQALQMSTYLDYSGRKDILQYVTETKFLDEPRYILATIDQKSVGMTFRIDFPITPELSFQYYGNLYVSLGKYSNYKHIIDPGASDYQTLYSVYNEKNGEINIVDGLINIDEDHNGIYDYSFENPDFNFREMRSNFVARWEYKPGSTLYFVWTNTGNSEKGYESNSVMENFESLFSLNSENIFLIKFNYWFSL